MIRAYFDDSCDPKRERYVAVGGFVTPVVGVSGNRVSGFDALELRWMAATHMLAEPFRSTDCETRHGQFKDWTVERSRALMQELVGILGDAGIVPFGMVVPVQEFSEVFPSLGEYGPLTLAFESAVAWLANYACGQRQELHVLVEHGTVSGKLQRSFERLQASSWRGARALGALTFGRKQSIGLQAADLIARECYKHFENLPVLSRPTRQPLKKLLMKAMVLNCYTPAALRRLRALGWPDDVSGFAAEVF